MLQYLFPREEGTDGYCIPKLHGMTKFMFYIQRYGSGMNFFGGPGESAHKFFVKAPGLKTEQRVKEFAVQTAKQYYDIMVTQYALQSIEPKPDQQRIFPNKATENSDAVTVHLSGKYSVVVTNAVLQSTRDGNCIHVNWHSDRLHIKNDDDRYCLDGQLVTFILSRLDMMDSRSSTMAIVLKDIQESLQRLIMAVKFFCMHTHHSKVKNGMTGNMYTLRNLTA